MFRQHRFFKCDVSNKKNHPTLKITDISTGIETQHFDTNRDTSIVHNITSALHCYGQAKALVSV